ncbi:hypothetical protein [Thermococcus sp. Bubb.Bath]|uniref:hypothetical protein n=1 Tax=Thermococcus sp. Bubb.Bath TaxID=1638242 RepID=UPI00143C5E0A|nr:hypothetical protein [Thermococcus sp. Bubb.Bath]NJF26132.1 hypothetical protein [Thermococcus sp. Bubb.Bath]
MEDVEMSFRKLYSLIFTIMVFAMIFAAGCISGHGHKSTPSIPLKPVACPTGKNLTLINDARNVTLEDPSYRLAVNLMKGELEEAKALYQVAVLTKGNKNVLTSLSNLSRELLSDSTIINDTAIRIGNATYTYVVLSVCDYHDPHCKEEVRFLPDTVDVSGVVARLLPPNWTTSTATYTGIPYRTYVVTLGNRTCRVYFNELSTLIMSPLTAKDYLLLIDGGKAQSCGSHDRVYTIHVGFSNANTGERKEISLLLIGVE